VSGSGKQTAKVIPQPPAPVAAAKPAPEPRPDPVATLIASSDQHFETGQKELTLGHLERAKAEFNAALDTLLESPDGARSNTRLREHFDRLVDRISVLEQAAWRPATASPKPSPSRLQSIRYSRLKRLRVCRRSRARRKWSRPT